MDILASLAEKEIKLYPGEAHGYVRLVDCLPRVVPEGRGCDYVIAQRARVSTGQGLKSPEADARLIERLYKDQHTSPFEGVSFVYELEVPGFVAQQLLRHRTAKVNVFSQRYAEVPETLGWYTPPVRVPHPQNKQMSVPSADQAKKARIEMLQNEADRALDILFRLYHAMIAEGCAREVARYCLPTSTYTRLVFEMDLNNLIKFFRLRCAPDAQEETRVVAQAMKDLVLPLLPVVGKLI
jgi:thymidylate synthase (FAD)